jgi:Site-specific recombinases, DNA invertase Pin homologs
MQDRSHQLAGRRAVAARELSRFAPNSREWQRLVEVCRVVDTLLIDLELVYTPRQSNHRLLLGVKGSLDECELDLLRQRSLEARREKARRGQVEIVDEDLGRSAVETVTRAGFERMVAFLSCVDSIRSAREISASDAVGPVQVVCSSSPLTHAAQSQLRDPGSAVSCVPPW